VGELLLFSSDFAPRARFDGKAFNTWHIGMTTAWIRQET
jgi:hypothetical protein